MKCSIKFTTNIQSVEKKIKDISVYFTFTGEEIKHATGIIDPISISNVEM
jgi:hypothetical protein